MMKKMIALATAFTFVCALPALAADAGVKKAEPFKAGMITKWDAAAKQFTLKDTKGIDTSFVWNEKTTLAGSPKAGEHAYVWYTTGKDGAVKVTHVTVVTKIAMKKAPEAPKK